MDEIRPVSIKEINLIAGAMSGTSHVLTENKNLTEDTTITTRKQLIKALKEGRIPGNAILEWSDDQGTLRANIIDYLLYKKVRARDVQTNESLLIQNQDLQDGSWRLLH